MGNSNSAGSSHRKDKTINKSTKQSKKTSRSYSNQFNLLNGESEVQNCAGMTNLHASYSDATTAMGAGATKAYTEIHNELHIENQN